MHLRALLATILYGGLLQAQPTTPLGGTAELQEVLDRLTTVGSVLMLGAHPDDENTAVMAYFARGMHLRTVYMSATRGEGGQNLIGSEQGPLMGVIRTHELLEARRIDGGEQAFGGMIDFGYTKTPDETLQIWGDKNLLREMVRVIRTVRPDVIVSRFPPRPGSGGHGHHTAVGWTGPTAFEVAGDPAQFTELGLPAWKTRRYYFNVPTFGRRTEEAAARRGASQVRLELGGYDPVLGKSYAEISGESRSMHRSQGMGTSQRRGSVPAFFRFVDGEPSEGGLFEGIDLSWGRIDGAGLVGRKLQQARETFNPRDPSQILPHLLAAYDALSELSGPEVDYKLGELRRAIELASGIWIDATADRWGGVPGDSLDVTVEAMRRSEPDWTWKSTRIVGVASVSVGEETSLEQDRAYTHSTEVAIPADTCYSQPYWLEQSGPRGGEGCGDTGETPGPAPVLRAIFTFDTPQGVVVELEKPVVYRWVDRSFGERFRPLGILPAVSVSFANPNRVFLNGESASIRVLLRANTGSTEATLRLAAPTGWSVKPESHTLQFARRDHEQTADFEVAPPAGMSGGDLVATAEVGETAISTGVRTIEYDHIPMTPVFPRAAMRVENIDVTLLSKNVGYVMGAGDRIPEALEQLGATVSLLSAEDLAGGDLTQFDAIVAGVRALNTRPDLIAARERAMEYVEQGGTLIVQYNTSSFRRGPTPSAPTVMGPYPMTASRLRVTDEGAKIAMPSPEHPLLNAPNKITPKDFEGWVQERGLYFMSDWDERYDVILACSDPGEQPLEGGMLYARYGKGAYVFTAYSWFRQLPAGVPGAYRMFANIISAGKVGQ